MFNKHTEQNVRELQADYMSQRLEIRNLNCRIEELEEKIQLELDKIHKVFKDCNDTYKGLAQECRRDYQQLSKWDDQRRDEIRALADAAGLEIRRGVHLAPSEEDNLTLTPKNK